MFKEKLTHGFERSILSLCTTGLDWIEIERYYALSASERGANKEKLLNFNQNT